jgi:RNA polymerase sigma-70 factor, ECF subfamily
MLVLSNTLELLRSQVQDREIVANLKNRDDETFRMVVGKYHFLVLNCAYKFLRNRETAEDLAQEVFVEVFQSIHAFRGESQLSTWIYRITVTKCLNLIKHQKRKKRFAELVSIFGANEMEEQLPAPESTNPMNEMERRERIDILSKAFDKLPDSQRIAYTLSKVDGMKYEEIASVMNLSLPSVESLIHRAKNNLVKGLRGYYESHLS